MPNPIKYRPSFDFSDFSGVQPMTPLPGVQIDAQLDDISLASEQAVDALADVRNPDGSLKDGIVTIDSLAPSLITQLAATTAGAAASAAQSRDTAVAAATTAEVAKDEAVQYANYLDAIDQALANRDYVQDYGLITEPADTVIDDGLITDPAD